MISSDLPHTVESIYFIITKGKMPKHHNNITTSEDGTSYSHATGDFTPEVRERLCDAVINH